MKGIVLAGGSGTAQEAEQPHARRAGIRLSFEITES